MYSVHLKFSAISIIILISTIISQKTLTQTIVNISASQPPQLIVDAGDDATINAGEEITLGAIQTATGGSGDYIYIWDHPAYLNNSALANPVATPPGNLTFTVTVTDDNGCSDSDAVTITVIGGTGIYDKEAGINFKIFPNPGNGSFTIAVTNITGNERCKISITNLSGQKVYEETCDIKANFEKEIDISYISKGFYILIVHGDSVHLEKQLILH